MKKLLGGIALALFVGGLLAQPAAAQWGYAPVYTSPAGYEGLLVSADFGMGLNDDAKVGVDDSPMAFAGRIGFGTSGFNITGLFSYVDTKNDALKKTPSFGANVGYTILKQETGLAVNAFAGFGYWDVKADATDESVLKVMNIPFGIGIGFSPPSEGPVGFEIWAAPRGNYQTQDPGVDKANRFGFGASGGVNVNFAQGFGIHAAIDWTTFSEKTVEESVYPKVSPLIVGAGLHYNFRVGS
jgi:opacity protein-like surface antigen